MKPGNLILSCYAEKIKGTDQWQAFCLDLCLAAQGDSLRSVKQKLNDMIYEYVTDALTGNDRDFAFSLLKRKAPLRYWLKFYFYCAMYKIGVVRDGVRQLFCPAIPMGPVNYKHAA